jgi:hypothetical protein
MYHVGLNDKLYGSQGCLIVITTITVWAALSSGSPSFANDEEFDDGGHDIHTIT